MKSIRTGEIRVNSIRVRDVGIHIFEGDEITVPWELHASNSDSEKNFTKFSSWGKIIPIFEGENVLILNKPAGILVQPDISGADSVISRVWGVMKSKIPAAVHRLDRNTTGVLCVALRGDSLRALEELFKARKIRKVYRAVVVGKAPEEMTIEAPLLKDSENNIVSVNEDGMRAVTRCKRLELLKGGKFSLVELELLTGRTHQARVHMAYIKCPILGDKKYGNFKVNRLMKNIHRPLLHAYSLEFPNGVSKSLSEISGKKFTAELPSDFEEFINEN